MMSGMWSVNLSFSSNLMPRSVIEVVCVKFWSEI